MEAIIISVSQYKEKDAVITAITNNELITFYARGIYNKNNPNAFLSCVFAILSLKLHSSFNAQT